MKLNELKKLSGLPINEGLTAAEVVAQHLTEDDTEWMQYASDGWSSDAYVLGVDDFNNLMDDRLNRATLSEGMNNDGYAVAFNKIKNLGNQEAMKIIWNWIHQDHISFNEFSKLASDYWRYEPPANKPTNDFESF
jgi:hypothetical protein